MLVVISIVSFSFYFSSLLILANVLFMEQKFKCIYDNLF